MPSRDDLAAAYFEQLPHEPYPVQEEALLTWFTAEQGVLVCAPTGTGKTLIAQAALFEALHTGKVAYYTTPLIALTDQKFQEMQEAAVRWGFQKEDVGLVTGNRKVNPDAKVLVVVAEILLNRLLHESAFSFENVSAVVMDEFHSFNDPERGIVWELSLGLLPQHVRLMLLSATVGNAFDFITWLRMSHGRRLELVQGTERKIPLRYHWIADELLTDQLERMADGDEATRQTPALVFCFNRDECWNVADVLRGKDMLAEGQQKLLIKEVDRYDWSKGIGPKLRSLLQRGVGVHHAGVLPRYKRIVEDLFQRKLLTICVCTETLSAGMNLPARSVLMTSLLKGPPGKKTLIDPSIAHQMFGRAGRPQFDSEGHVFALAHEDDVKILRFKERLDQIPEDTKDPLLIKKRKELKKKMPTRRKGEQYWNQEQFEKLIAAPPTHLRSQGQLPWRLMAYLLSISADVSRVRQVVNKRLLDGKRVIAAQSELDQMLLTLEAGEYVLLAPESPVAQRLREAGADAPTLLQQIKARAQKCGWGETTQWTGTSIAVEESLVEEITEDDAFGFGLGDDDEVSAEDVSQVQAAVSVSENGKGEAPAKPQALPQDNEVAGETRETAPPPDKTQAADRPVEPVLDTQPAPTKLSSTLKFLLAAQGVRADGSGGRGPVLSGSEAPLRYEAVSAFATEKLLSLLSFKSINPLYGNFLLDVLPFAEWYERVQALESVLAFTPTMAKFLRIPRGDFLPPGRMTQDFLNIELLQRGLATQAELAVTLAEDQWDLPPEERIWPLTFPEKLMRLFQSEFPSITDVPITAVWAVGEVLHMGDFNKLVTSRKLARQEGLLFRHLLRFILLCDEFLPHLSVDSAWHIEMTDICSRLTDICRAVDPQSTDQMIESGKADALTE